MLKILASLLMVIDHVGVIFADRMTPDTYNVFRLLGRPAFPMFCLGIALGLLRTRDKARYWRRMALSALFTQVLFRFFMTRWDYDWLYFYNVLITFVCSMTVILAVENLRAHAQQPRAQRPLRLLGDFLSIGLSFGIAVGYNPDYDLFGMLVVLSFYAIASHFVSGDAFAGTTALSARPPIFSSPAKTLPVRVHPASLMLYFAALLLACLLYGLHTYALYGSWYVFKIEMASLAAILFFPLDRVRWKVPKSFFYLFYPLHFLLLMWLGMR